MKRHLCLALIAVTVILALQYVAIRMHREIAGEGGEIEHGCSSLNQCFSMAWDNLLTPKRGQGAAHTPVCFHLMS